MLSEDLKQLKPFLSIVIIIVSLFTLVFLQMEERRLGYEILVLNKDLKKSIDQRRVLDVRLAQALRPEKVEQVAARKSTLNKAISGQIIQMGMIGDLE